MSTATYTFPEEVREIARRVRRDANTRVAKAEHLERATRLLELLFAMELPAGSAREDILAAIAPFGGPANSQLTKEELASRLSASAARINEVSDREGDEIYKRERPLMWVRDNARKVAALAAQLATWAETKFKADPAYELEWSGGVFDTAAELRARKVAAKYAEVAPGVALNAVRQELERQISQGWKSTSVPSNLINDCYRIALYGLEREMHQWNSIEPEAEQIPMRFDEERGVYVRAAEEVPA